MARYIVVQSGNISRIPGVNTVSARNLVLSITNDTVACDRAGIDLGEIDGIGILFKAVISDVAAAAFLDTDAGKFRDVAHTAVANDQAGYDHIVGAHVENMSLMQAVQNGSTQSTQRERLIDKDGAVAVDAALNNDSIM